MGIMRTYVNLLPLKHRRAGLLRALLPRWCTVWVIGAVVLAGVVWLNKSHHQQMLAAVSDREAASKPIVAIIAQNSQMEQEIRRFDHRETLVGQLRDNKPVLCFLAAVSKSSQLCNGRVVVRDLTFQQQAVKPLSNDRHAGAAQPAPSPQAVLTLEGDALDNVAIARFTAALQASALFRDVVLESSVGKSSADQTIHSFIVRCEI